MSQKPKAVHGITIVVSEACPPDRAFMVSGGCPRCHGRMAWTVYNTLECATCGQPADERTVRQVVGLAVPVPR